MVKFLPLAVVSFAILCLVCDASKNKFASSEDDSPNDSPELISQSTSSNNPSTGTIIHPSTLSKEEERELETIYNKQMGNKEQDTLSTDEKSNAWNMKDLFRYVVSLLRVANQNKDDSLDKSTDNRNIIKQDLRSNNTVDGLKNNEEAEVENTDILNKSTDDEKIQNSDNIAVLESADDEKVQKSEDADADNKSLDGREMQNLSYKDSLNMKEPKKYLKMQNPTDKDSVNVLKNSKKTETQNIAKTFTPTNSFDKGEMPDHSNNEYMNNRQPKKVPKKETQDSTEKYLTDELDNKIKTIKQNLKKSAIPDDDFKSTLNNKIQNTTTTFKDYKDYNTGEITLDKTTPNNFLIEDVNKYGSDNIKEKKEEVEDVNENDNDENDTEDDKEEEDGDDDDDDDANENNMDETVAEDDYINESNYNNENGVNKNYDKIKENNYNYQGQRLRRGSQISQVENITDEKAHDTTLPKFVVQAVRHPHDDDSPKDLPELVYLPKTLPPNNQINSNDKVMSGVTTSHKKINKEKTSPEFLLSSSEFVDNYINNPQRKNPETGKEQSSNNKTLIPNGNNVTSKIAPLIPMLKNVFEDYNRSLNTTSFYNKNMNDQNVTFDKSLNTGNNILPLFNGDRRDISPNQDLLSENYLQNNQNTLTSTYKPASFQDKNEATLLTPLPFEQIAQFPSAQYTFASPQENYDFRKPTNLIFQNNMPLIHNKAPTTNAYRSEIANPFQTYSKKEVAKDTDINLENNQQFIQKQPTVLRQEIISNIQNFPNQDAANAPDLTNKKSELLVNLPNMEKLVPNAKALSNSNDLPFHFPFNQMYKKNSTTIHTEKNLDKLSPQLQHNVMKQYGQIQKIQTLNTQSDSNNLPFKEKFSDQQKIFPKTNTVNTMLQSEKNNGVLPHKNKLNSKLLPDKNEFPNIEFSLPQNNISNVKKQPQRPFNTTEDDIENNKPKDEASLLIVPKNNVIKPFFPQPKPALDKPVNDKTQKMAIFDEKLKQQDAASDFDYVDDFGESSNYNYDREDDEEYEELTDFSEEYDTDENEDDFIDVNNYDYENNCNDDDNEDSYDNEENYDNDYSYDNEENYDNDYSYDNEDNYDRNKASDALFANQSSQPALDEKSRNINTTSQKVMSGGILDQQSYSEVQSSNNNNNNNVTPDNVIPERVKSDIITIKETSFPRFKIPNEKSVNDSMSKRPKKIYNQENKPKTLSREIINDGNVKIFPSPGVNDLTKSPKSLKTQSESLPSNQKGDFNTILEYIYKFSNNPLFKSLKEQQD